MPATAPRCGLPAMIRSGRMPSLIHHTASRYKPPTPGEAKGGPLSERIVVRTDCPRQAMLLERRLEDRPRVCFIRARHRLTAQQITAVRVAQGERIAPPAVRGAEPPPVRARGRLLKSVHHTSLAAATAATGRV